MAKMRMSPALSIYALSAGFAENISNKEIYCVEENAG
jgi:hypothetical protein